MVVHKISSACRFSFLVPSSRARSSDCATEPLSDSRGPRNSAMSSKDYDTKPAGGDDVRSVDDDSPPPGTGDAYTAPLHRKLKSRHLQMIAIGGIIGPGLLVGLWECLPSCWDGGDSNQFYSSGAYRLFYY